MLNLIDQTALAAPLGRWVAFRPMTPNDVGLLAEMMQRLSERTRELRFIMPRRRFTEAEAQAEALRLTQIDRARQTVLVAVMGDTDREEAIAVAEFVRTPGGPGVAEVGIVVRDDYQQHGIGSALIRRLWNVAETQGITSICAYILPENEGIRRLMRRMGVQYSSLTRYGVTEIHAQL